MGIIMGVLGAIVTFTMAMEGLRRLGIDLGWLNPLTFFRRRAWQKKTSLPPLYALTHPVDVVAVMALAIVQTTGAITTQQKAGVQALLSQHLNMNDADASSLWISAAHMLRSRPLDMKELPAVFGPSTEKFTDYHIETLKTVMQAAARIETPVSEAQQQLLLAVDAYFAQKASSKGPWAIS